MRIAVIPARGGSKRIPHKNIKYFGGKPMIAWSVAAAQESNCFDRIIVSTNDNQIADVARKYGAEIPFMRPEQLADDYIGTMPVIAHAVRELIEAGETDLTEVCCIYATAPFISASDIQRGLDLLIKEKSQFAFSVTSYAFPIQRAVKITPDMRVQMFNPEHFNTRSQDLEEAWHDAGQFYWGTSNAWLGGKPLFSNQAVPVVLPRHRVQDIDTPEDWLRAEWLFKAMQAEKELNGP